MKRRFYNFENYPFHVTGHCKFQQWPVPFMDLMWLICIDHLSTLYRRHDVVTHSFVLMDNHFHWLCGFDDKVNLSALKYFFKLLYLSFKEHNSESTPHDDLHDFFDSQTIQPIENIKHYTHSYKYIYRNPVSAGLCKKVETYPFSTIQQLLGQTRENFIFFDQMNFIYDSHRILNWLNSSSNQKYHYLTH